MFSSRFELPRYYSNSDMINVLVVYWRSEYLSNAIDIIECALLVSHYMCAVSGEGRLSTLTSGM